MVVDEAVGFSVLNSDEDGGIVELCSDISLEDGLELSSVIAVENEAPVVTDCSEN